MMFSSVPKEHTTPVRRGEGIEFCSQNLETWVGLDQWRPQSVSDLLLYKHFETVVFEKFALWGEKIGKIK